MRAVNIDEENAAVFFDEIDAFGLKVATAIVAAHTGKKVLNNLSRVHRGLISLSVTSHIAFSLFTVPFICAGV